MRLGYYCLLHTVLLMFIAVETCTAEYDICPAGFGEKIQDVFGASNYIQQGLRHRVPCPSFRQGEELEGVIWFKGPTTADEFRVLSRSVSEIYPTSDRYEFAPDTVSLVIRGVEKDDEGRYPCRVIPQETGPRDEDIDLHVLGELFPARNGVTSSSASFQRGRRQTLPCQCASPTPDPPISVVYWSTGEGVTADTDIIGARFSDGAVLRIQNGADYSIGSDASLTVNSLNDVQDTQRFWCHVFHQDGTLRNCYTDVQISDGESDHAFKADSSSFYLLKGAEQFVPCTSWTTGNTACEIRWFKVDTSGRQPLVSSNDVGANSAFDLTSEFGLIINSVDDDHAGTYRCDAGLGNSGDDIHVRVIGVIFPLDGGEIFGSASLALEAGKMYNPGCPALNTSDIRSKAAVIWSYGAPADAQESTVIGRLSLPDGSKTISDLGDNNCFGISSNGSLLLNNCSQDGDVRYWCHVFPENDVLKRSYVDATLKKVLKSSNAVIIIVLSVCLIALIAFIAIAVYLWKRRERKQVVILRQQLVEAVNTLEEAAMEFVKRRVLTVEMLKQVAGSLLERHNQAKNYKTAEKILGAAAVVLVLFGTGGTSAIVAGGAAVMAAVMDRLAKDSRERFTDRDTPVKILQHDQTVYDEIIEALKKVDSAWKPMRKTIIRPKRMVTKRKYRSRESSLVFSIDDLVAVRLVRTETREGGDEQTGLLNPLSNKKSKANILFTVVETPPIAQSLVSHAENKSHIEVAQKVYYIIDQLEIGCSTEEDMRGFIAQIRTKFEIDPPGSDGIEMA